MGHAETLRKLATEANERAISRTIAAIHHQSRADALIFNRYRLPFDEGVERQRQLQEQELKLASEHSMWAAIYAAGALALDAIATEKAWRAHESACDDCGRSGSMIVLCDEGGRLSGAAQDAMRKAMEVAP